MINKHIVEHRFNFLPYFMVLLGLCLGFLVSGSLYGAVVGATVMLCVTCLMAILQP